MTCIQRHAEPVSILARIQCSCVRWRLVRKLRHDACLRNHTFQSIHSYFDDISIKTDATTMPSIYISGKQRTPLVKGTESNRNKTLSFHSKATNKRTRWIHYYQIHVYGYETDLHTFPLIKSAQYVRTDLPMDIHITFQHCGQRQFNRSSYLDTHHISAVGRMLHYAVAETNWHAHKLQSCKVCIAEINYRCCRLYN